MTVYVRLSIGVEDPIPAFEGCAKCASPNIVNREECECGHWKRIYDANDNPIKFIPTMYWNPSVDQDSTGGLIIRKGKSQIAYYPKGAWISWRSD